MDTQIIVALCIGVFFLTVILGIGCYMAFRTAAAPIPEQAMFIFRVVLALAAAAFAVVLPGFLQIDAKILSVSIKAVGSLAIFVAVYIINPPGIMERKIPSPRKPRKVSIPADRIKNEGNNDSRS